MHLTGHLTFHLYICICISLTSILIYILISIDSPLYLFFSGFVFFFLAIADLLSSLLQNLKIYSSLSGTCQANAGFANGELINVSTSGDFPFNI